MKLVEKGIKEYGVEGISIENLESFFKGEGKKIMDKYSDKK